MALLGNSQIGINEKLSEIGINAKLPKSPINEKLSKIGIAEEVSTIGMNGRLPEIRNNEKMSTIGRIGKTQRITDAWNFVRTRCIGSFTVPEASNERRTPGDGH